MANTVLPVDGYIDNAARTHAEQQVAFDDFRQVTSELVGAGAETELTISAGNVTPSLGQHSIDTEADAATDDLSNILTTNMADGRLLVIRANDAGRTVVVKHQATGAGQIHIANATDVTLDDTTNMLVLQRRGTDWYEVAQTQPKTFLTAQLPTELDALNVAVVGVTAGLELSVGTDADHDINIAVGSVRDTTNAYTLTLSSVMTKQIDAAWAAGTNAGGLFTGTVANNTWYHVYLIRKDSDGSIDAGFSTSNSPTLPGGYTAYQRIGSRKTDGTANLLPMDQWGDWNFWRDPPLDVDVTNPGTAAVTRTLTVPNHVAVVAVINVAIDDSGTNDPFAYFSPLSVNDEAASRTAAPLAQLGVTGVGGFGGNAMVLTNTSQQIRSRVRGSGASTDLRISTIGWIDKRSL